MQSEASLDPGGAFLEAGHGVQEVRAAVSLSIGWFRCVVGREFFDNKIKTSKKSQT